MSEMTRSVSTFMRACRVWALASNGAAARALEKDLREIIICANACFAPRKLYHTHRRARRWQDPSITVGVRCRAFGAMRAALAGNGTATVRERTEPEFAL